MAIKHLPCVCGQSSTYPWATVNEIPIVECAACGIRRVERIDEDAYLKLYNSGNYHTDGSDDARPVELGRESITNRLEVDLEVANLRFQKLWDYKNGGTLLDVGCGNGAFMLAGQDHGYETYGIDLSADAAVEQVRGNVSVGDMRFAGYQRRTMDVITFNDSFEHFIEPLNALAAARGILKRDGVLVIEIPDMGCQEAVEQGPAFKHVKPHEHLWYFTATQLRELLEVYGFTVLGMDVPIPGKVTVYASPASTVEDIEILGPPGIGDILWTLHKIEGIRAREWPCRIKYVVCADGDKKIVTRAKDFLGLCNHIDSCEFRPTVLPRDVGCSDPSLPVYELFANDYLDPKKMPLVGEFIENWRPELPDAVNADIGVSIPDCAAMQASVRLRKIKNPISVYMSSHVWNRIVTEPLWTVKHWAELFIKLSDAGYTPLILGAGWDMDYAHDVASEIVNAGRVPNKVWINTIGRTSVPLVMAYMALSKAAVGIANGLPMLPPYFGTPTVMLWPVRGVSAVEITFCAEFQTNWLLPKYRTDRLYKPMAIGTFTVDDLFNELIKKANGI